MKQDTWCHTILKEKRQGGRGEESIEFTTLYFCTNLIPSSFPRNILSNFLMNYQLDGRFPFFHCSNTGRVV